MKVLLDTCVWGGTKDDLISAGYDVIWTGDWDKDPGDEEILAYAKRENRVLITLDKDFGELAVVFGLPHSGIVRLVNLSAKEQGKFCLEALKHYGDALLSGAIVTVERNRIRIRENK
jgi:predicted nuclease of predicted toxin-antitoxin system